jgi:hypothetical protein
MTLPIDEGVMRRIVQAVSPRATVEPGDARTILQLAELAAGVDLDDDEAEDRFGDALARHLCALAGISPDTVPPLARLPIDEEERDACVAALAQRLSSPESRELALVVAYLMIASDLELAPIETHWLEKLQLALGIDDGRASELVTRVSELVTPGVETLEQAGAPE